MTKEKDFFSLSLSSFALDIIYFTFFSYNIDLTLGCTRKFVTTPWDKGGGGVWVDETRPGSF